jgi:hypothetical protein
MALLAATTLGAGQFGHVKAQIATDSSFQGTEDGRYRLIVQSYAAENVKEGNLPEDFARPIGSSQRAVTARELRDGVAVDLVEVGETSSDRVLIAWVEQGAPDLDFDAREARPTPGSRYGTALPADGTRVLLSRQA